MSSADNPGSEEAKAEEPDTAAPPGEPAAPPADPPEPEPEPVDEVRQPMLETLREQLGDDLLDSEIAGGDIWVRVERAAWRRAAEVCKSALGMEYFCFLSGIDWLPNPGLSGEKLWDPEEQPVPAAESGAFETGVAGGTARFQVFARLYNTDKALGITLKADLDDERPEVDSWVPVYRGADWHERETWEMYGFDFLGHPGLRHMYLPAEFEGFPQRKDFPLLAREVKPWPGLVDKEPIPGEEEEADTTAGGDAT